MTHCTRIAVLFVFLAPAAAGADGPLPADYEFCAVVQDATRQETLYRVHLPEEIVRESAPGMYDLRLFDDRLQEVPFTVIDHAPFFEEKNEAQPLEITGHTSGPATDHSESA